MARNNWTTPKAGMMERWNEVMTEGRNGVKSPEILKQGMTEFPRKPKRPNSNDDVQMLWVSVKHPSETIEELSGNSPTTTLGLCSCAIGTQTSLQLVHAL